MGLGISKLPCTGLHSHIKGSAQVATIELSFWENAIDVALKDVAWDTVSKTCG